MKPANPVPFIIQSVAQQHALLGLPGPQHPLISVAKFEDMAPAPVADSLTGPLAFTTRFYTIALKKDCPCKTKYGWQSYDFDRGVMSFTPPGRRHVWEAGDALPPTGWLLNIHPDFLLNYPLAGTIRTYGFFAYATHEALHLSEKEEVLVEALLDQLAREYDSAIDAYSQDALVAHTELLLTYANRFYNRQFITRRHAHHAVVARLDALLTDYYQRPDLAGRGLPTVQYVAEQLNLSPNYLGDLLRSLTGWSTQQHIHDKLMSEAKELLRGTSLTVSEIAYRLGFEHPQSFSKLFKNKAQVSPLAFRQRVSEGLPSASAQVLSENRSRLPHR